MASKTTKRKPVPAAASKSAKNRSRSRPRIRSRRRSVPAKRAGGKFVAGAGCGVQLAQALDQAVGAGRPRP